MTERLIALGHRDIAFIRGNPTHSAATRRWQGFCDACTDAGIVVPTRRVLQGDFTFKSGLAATEAILSSEDRPTAIFASNDDMAFAALMVAMRHGVIVPDTLSIVGFDDALISRMAWPQITTIHQPNAEMAAVAVEMLIGNLSRSDKEAGRCVELNYSFIDRPSSGVAPAAKT
jgi:LacI family transcriptional regulator